jgi:Holliday junction resolvasome RuvABC ATP-dependent DNA helicase subunit
MEYTPSEKEVLIQKYLKHYGITTDESLIRTIAEKVGNVPREIHNLCIKVRDYVITKSQDKILTKQLREDFLKHSQIDEGGMTPLHAKYLEILEKADRPMGAKAIAVQL